MILPIELKVKDAMQRTSTRFALVTVLVVLLGLALSAIAGAQAAPPEISGVTPSPIDPSPSPQAVAVSGNHFLPRLTLTVTGPGGSSADYKEPAIHELTETSFAVPVVFTKAGTYRFVVTNADGRASNAFSMEAKAQSQTPVIEAVRPDRIDASPNQQTITVIGQRFVPGSSVTITDPTGNVQNVPVGAITDVRPTSMQVTVALEVAGDHSIVVTTPAGLTSNSFAFRVGPRRF
jgi:hypothetical protein